MKSFYLITAFALGFLFCPSGLKAQNDSLVVKKAGYYGPADCYDSAFYFISRGENIFYRKWGFREIGKNPKIILIIHGLGYHCHPYKKIMNYLQGDSVLVYAMDLKGHGHSGGIKGVLDSGEENLEDINNMIYEIKKDNPDSKIFLMGPSMGGLYALGYAIHDTSTSKISGLILSGPAMRVCTSRIFQLKSLKIFWLSAFNQRKAGVVLDGRDLMNSCRNQAWINLRRTDTLALHCLSVEYLRKVHEMQRKMMCRTDLASIAIPVLIQHGGKDKIADLKGSFYLKENLIHAPTELIVYPDSYHTLLWDNDSIHVFNDIVSWIRRN